MWLTARLSSRPQLAQGGHATPRRTSLITPWSYDASSSPHGKIDPSDARLADVDTAWAGEVVTALPDGCVARQLRLHCQRRGTEFGYSVFKLSVY